MANAYAYLASFPRKSRNRTYTRIHTQRRLQHTLSTGSDTHSAQAPTHTGVRTRAHWGTDSDTHWSTDPGTNWDTDQDTHQGTDPDALEVHILY